jgi:hypothetical protein
VILGLVPYLAPPGVIAILLSASSVLPCTLQVSVRLRADPDIPPCRRNGKRGEPSKLRRVRDAFSAGGKIVEVLATSQSADGRLTTRNIFQRTGASCGSGVPQEHRGPVHPVTRLGAHGIRRAMRLGHHVKNHQKHLLCHGLASAGRCLIEQMLPSLRLVDAKITAIAVVRHAGTSRALWGRMGATPRDAIVTAEPLHYAFALCELEVRARRLVTRGVVIHLERKTFDLLVYLLANRERVVTKQELNLALWGGLLVSEGALTALTPSSPARSIEPCRTPRAARITTPTRT